MVRFFKAKTILWALLLLAIGCGVGYFAGTAKPSPGYAEGIRRVPIEHNSWQDVSEIVREHLPENAYEAFDVISAASFEVRADFDEPCGCTLIFMSQSVARYYLPPITVYHQFRVEDGRLTYDGSWLANWSL